MDHNLNSGLDYYKKIEEKKRLLRKQLYLLERYSMDIEDYDKMLSNQGGKCYICGYKKKVYSILFFEATKIPKAILCNPCHRRLIVPKKPEYQERLNSLNNITVDQVKSFLGISDTGDIFEMYKEKTGVDVKQLLQSKASGTNDNKVV